MQSIQNAKHWKWDTAEADTASHAKGEQQKVTQI